ncbi:hypothetical protein [Vibrio sp. 10N]|uniref:hypothetical protein n=1 Tax=Vibrio sp. 10N TaxID=3058938 RepID=UPI002813E9A2|nr:hypothetical protein VB10N_19210 [Vibrio sp. 10N]
MQPRWLVSQLEELDYQADYQLDLVMSLLQQSQSMNALTQDYIGLAKSDVFACHELYEALLKGYEQTREEAQTRHARVEEQLDHASETERASTRSLEDAHNLCSKWGEQKDKAERWLSRAKAHLAHCQSEVARAQGDYSQAQHVSQLALAALEAARARPPVKVYDGQDSNGNARYRYEKPSTHAEEAALAAAKVHEANCLQILNAAIKQRNLAQKECDRAEHQVNGATRALSESRQSVVLADQTLAVSSDAKRQANQSLDYSMKCLALLEQVKELLEAFEATCLDQTHTVSGLQNNANQALLELRDLENQQEAIQGEVFSLKYTLQDKVSLLIAFDQPLNHR